MNNTLSFKIAVGLFIFGLVMSIFTAYGLNPENSQITYATLDEDDYIDLSEDVQNKNIGPFTAISLVFTIGGVLLDALWSVFTILPILLRLGLPLPIALLFQAPIWLVYTKDVFTYFTGH